MSARRILGRDLRPGMALPLVSGGHVLVVAVRPYQVPARVLHDSVAARHPEGLPARIIDTDPSQYGMTVFDDDFIDVIDPA